MAKILDESLTAGPGGGGMPRCPKACCPELAAERRRWRDGGDHPMGYPSRSSSTGQAENVYAAGADVERLLWVPLGSAGLFVGAAVPLAGVWALRRRSGGARRCSACHVLFDPGPLGTYVPRD